MLRGIMATPAWAELMQRYKATSAFLDSAEFSRRALHAHYEIGRLTRDLGFRT
jgi:hypothetical protein